MQAPSLAKVLEEMKRRPVVTIDGARTMLKRVQEDIGEDDNRSQTEMENQRWKKREI